MFDIVFKNVAKPVLKENITEGESISFHTDVFSRYDHINGKFCVKSDLRNLATNELYNKKSVGVVFLAGGAATRFGGKIKALYNVIDDISFLEAKVLDVVNVAKNHNIIISRI